MFKVRFVKYLNVILITTKKKVKAAILKQKIRHSIAISLLLLFLVSITTKEFDFYFHHHDEIHCTAKNVKHFHTYKEKCTVATFTLGSFIYATGIKLTFFKARYFVQKQTALISFFQKELFYSFLLRGPPTILK